MTPVLKYYLNLLFFLHERTILKGFPRTDAIAALDI